MIQISPNYDWNMHPAAVILLGWQRVPIKGVPSLCFLTLAWRRGHGGVKLFSLVFSMFLWQKVVVYLPIPWVTKYHLFHSYKCYMKFLKSIVIAIRYLESFSKYTPEYFKKKKKKLDIYSRKYRYFFYNTSNFSLNF